MGHDEDGRSHTAGSRRPTGIAVALLLVVSACSTGGKGGSSSPEETLVVTTVSPITNIAANVVCDRARVVGLVPEGRSSHTFQPRPSDAVLLAQANVVFVNGLNLEPRSVQLAEANVRPGVEIIELGRRTISPDEYIFDFSFPQDTGDPNPHLWTNPRYVKRYAEIIAEELAAIDPAGAAEYRVNARVFGDRIDALDAALRRATATIPPERRLLLTYHDSFPYFARDYGWTVIGAIQPSDFSEPSPREVADLIRQIQGTGVSAIFGSEVFPSPVLEQIAREAGVEYIPDLRDDDLPGDPGDGDHSLLALLLFDFRTIVGALGGDPAHFDGVPTENVCDAAEYRS